MNVLHLTILKDAKLTINFFKLLLSIRDNNGYFSTFVTRGWIRWRQHSVAEHCPLPRDSQISRATEYHRNWLFEHHKFSFIPDSLFWDISISGFL